MISHAVYEARWQRSPFASIAGGWHGWGGNSSSSSFRVLGWSTDEATVRAEIEHNSDVFQLIAL